MVQKAIAGNKKFRTSDIELKRKGISYTVDTLHAFKDQYPKSKLFFILGGDNFRQFRSWKSPEEILALATIVVYHRPGVKQIKNIHNRTVVFLKGAMFDLSSTMIREQLHRGESIKYLVSPAVERYIYKNLLYKHSGRKMKAKE
jgi:nicotinate-nucleotide adenylyltransferase